MVEIEQLGLIQMLGIILTNTEQNAKLQNTPGDQIVKRFNTDDS